MTKTQRNLNILNSVLKGESVYSAAKENEISVSATRNIVYRECEKANPGLFYSDPDSKSGEPGIEYLRANKERFLK